MHHNLFSAARLLASAFFLIYIFSIDTSAQSFQTLAPMRASASAFANPVTKSSFAGCAAVNLRAERFAAEMESSERVRLCQALDKITNKLNRTAWSPALNSELQSIWRVFSNEPITLRSMPPGTAPQMLAMAQPFPDGSGDGRFAAAVYVRAEKSFDESFFQILFHELRHVLDFHETWKNRVALDSMEIERRAYRLMGKLTEETPETENFSGVPKFWKESWRKRTAGEISAKREAAIEKHLHGKKLYHDLAGDPNRRTLDYSYLKTSNPYNRQHLTGANSARNGERLPSHKALPLTAAVLPQNIREADFNLEKPKNPADPKEILRVALSNEKKLFYGMSNFVYDQKLAFQCLKDGRVSAAFAENSTVARTGDGNALFELTHAPAALPCVLNYSDLKTDFTDTFWASPALEKMPIYFSGFQELEGVKLAAYTVQQPDARLFDEMANEFPQIRPFRVIVGTIYISPEDGQIVRFAGTSFPEENVTGDYAKKVRCTYWVKAVRQKLNIENGLWVTVHVGSVAVANVQGKIRPFNYTVKFENYRQSETDVRILDDEVIAGNVAR